MEYGDQQQRCKGLVLRYSWLGSAALVAEASYKLLLTESTSLRLGLHSF